MAMIMPAARIALNTNPINPMAEIPNNFGPLLARIVSDEPISNAARIIDIES